MPEGAAIHNVFHVSQLKKATGAQVLVQPTLPEVDDARTLKLEPTTMLARRVVEKRRDRKREERRRESTQTFDWAQQDEQNTTSTIADSEQEEEGEDSAAEEGPVASYAAAEDGDDAIEAQEPSEDAKVFVGNLPYDVDGEKLAMLFEQAGTVEIAERALDDELDNLLAQRSDLDKQLVHLQKSAEVLEIVKADSDYMLSNVGSTCDLADHVSAKVRELDLAQSRVNTTVLRIDAIVERGNCIDGVKYVQTFLHIDAKYKDSGSEQRDQLLASKKQLEGIVRKRLADAVDQRDHPTILRFIRLYSPLGLEEEGLQVYVGYLKKVISMRSRLEFEHLVELMEQGHAQNQVDFVGCLTNLFKDIVLAIEENDEILRSLCGEDGIVYAICELQEECDSRGSLILKKYMEYRKLAKLASEINAQNKNLLAVGGPEGPDPREVELYLQEILSLMQIGENYTEFMVSKIKALSSVDPELVPRATKSFRSGSFSKVVQDITGFYVILEGFFMVENVRKAIRIDEQVPDSLTTSMVDVVFYVLQSCLRREISTSNISSVIAVLSGAGSPHPWSVQVSYMFTLRSLHKLYWSFSAVGVDPAIMGVGPAVAIPADVEAAGLELEDIDLFVSMCIGTGMGAAAVFERGDCVDGLCNAKKIDSQNLLSKDAK
ncbi:unnamed protein product [Linum tenue]|uniref:Conserved oligomeric Golgi complex subunit 4 n=1 Tax=Linum tenue TaxID=586396 RepID=A0AAV0LF98_9ROSI|nr:unnamed protein product [Linum tenue]